MKHTVKKKTGSRIDSPYRKGNEWHKKAKFEKKIEEIYLKKKYFKKNYKEN